jgi:hypothetical protein
MIKLINKIYRIIIKIINKFLKMKNINKPIRMINFKFISLRNLIFKIKINYHKTKFWKIQ